MNLNTILLALDSNEEAPEAWQQACVLAKTFGAELILQHSIPEAPESNPEFDVVSTQIEELFSDLRQQAEGKGVKVQPTFRIEAGEPADCILASAKATQADLILLGAGKKSTLERLLLGSTAERVSRLAKRPVWLVRPGHYGEPKQIVASIDDSKPARAALSAAVFLARTFVSRLGLLTVVPKASAALGAVDERVLNTCAAEFDLHGIDIYTKVAEGSVEDGVVQAVKDGCDLLVIGSEGRTGFSRFWHANTAERLVRKVACSLLVVKEPV